NMPKEEDINTNKQVKLKEMFSRDDVLSGNCNVTKEIKAEEELLQDSNDSITQEKCYTDDREAKICDMTNVEIQQITLKQVIDFVEGLTNITEICAAKFHIHLISSRWYYKDLDGSNEPFFTAEKFIEENSTTFQCESLVSINYLCAFQQANRDFLEESLNSSQQKMLYEKLHGMYKKAIQKALQSKVKSQQLIKLLQDYTEKSNEVSEEETEEAKEESDDDKESNNDKKNQMPALLNLKKRRRKG
ncbi:35463_t:CDS:2, partial [Racocetra persica]